MSRANQYYLIARERLTNEFSVIPVNGKRGLSLEEIDLYTTKFDGEEDLASKLRKTGIISYEMPDFYIASQGKKGKSLNTQEILYKKQSVVREIADNSRNHEIQKSEALIDSILDSFGDKMRRSPLLYEQVVEGRTNVYEKYAHYFLFTYQKPSTIKYRDGGWARTSYPLVRNVVEAVSRSNMKYSRLSDQMYRGLLNDKVLEVTDPDYDPNQLSFFHELLQDIDVVDEDKLLNVMGTFEKLPASTVLMSDHDVFFNPSTFEGYSEGDLEKLETYLPKEIRLYLRLFLIQRDMLGVSPITNGSSERKIVKAQKDMIEIFRSHPDILDRANEWCQLYDSYKEKTLGDSLEYQKKK